MCYNSQNSLWHVNTYHYSVNNIIIVIFKCFNGFATFNVRLWHDQLNVFTLNASLINLQNVENVHLKLERNEQCFSLRNNIKINDLKYTIGTNKRTDERQVEVEVPSGVNTCPGGWRRCLWSIFLHKHMQNHGSKYSKATTSASLSQLFYVQVILHINSCCVSISLKLQCNLRH